MKKTDLKLKFDLTIALIQKAASRDAMLINETSPAMVRFLCGDNKFRTLKIIENKDITNIQLTKSDDPASALVDFTKFIKDQAGTVADNGIAEKKKKAKLLAAQKKEAEAHRKKRDINIENDKGIKAEKIKEEAAKLKAAKNPKPKKKTSKKITKTKKSTKKKK